MTVEFRLEWGDGGDIRAPELRATWCSLSIEVAGRVVTAVRAPSGGPRTSINVSSYPLAEWIVEYWYRVFDWQQVNKNQHIGLTLRSAGDGFLWPDLRFTAEGAVIRCEWSAGRAGGSSDVEFLASDRAYVARESLEKAFAAVVESTISRLHGAGITESDLEQRWGVLQSLPPEEREFLAAAAHLGLDGFDVSADAEASIVDADRRLPAGLLLPVLDSTDLVGLPAAVDWVDRARRVVSPAAEPVPSLDHPSAADTRPWQVGYGGARELRSRLAARPLTSFPIERFVRVEALDRPSNGVEAYSATAEDRTGLVVTGTRRSSPSIRFFQARALGMWVLFAQNATVLAPTHRWQDQAARAFAAELLVPSADLRQVAVEVGGYWTAPLEEGVAERYDVSPRLIHDQLMNHGILAAA